MHYRNVFCERKRTKWHEVVSAVIYFWTIDSLVSWGEKNCNNSWKLLTQESQIKSLTKAEAWLFFSLGCPDKINTVCSLLGISWVTSRFTRLIVHGQDFTGGKGRCVCVCGEGSFSLVCKAWPMVNDWNFVPAQENHSYCTTIHK